MQIKSQNNLLGNREEIEQDTIMQSGKQPVDAHYNTVLSNRSLQHQVSKFSDLGNPFKAQRTDFKQHIINWTEQPEQNTLILAVKRRQSVYRNPTCVGDKMRARKHIHIPL